MSIYDKLIVSTNPAPPKIILYGLHGVGKTTFAADAGALVVDCENGCGAIPNLKRTPYLETWEEMRSWLVGLAKEKKLPNVLAVDTLDWMIQRIIEHVTIKLDGKKPDDVTNTLGSAHGGFFKARDIVKNIVYRDMIPILNSFTARGCAVLMLAHAANLNLKSPEGFDIPTAAPALPEWILGTFVEWVDIVFYATDDQTGRNMRARGTPSVMAKNRYSLPDVIPMSWNVFMDAFEGKSK